MKPTITPTISILYDSTTQSGGLWLFPFLWSIGFQPNGFFGGVPTMGTKIIQHHRASGGTRKLSNSSMVHTWSVSPAAMAGLTGFHFFCEPFRPFVGRLWGRRCRQLRWGTTK